MPTINFIDPVGISKYSDSALPNAAIEIQHSFSGLSQKALQTNSFNKNLLVLIGSEGGIRDTINVNEIIKIPPPPLGRQIIITFPPIYKERKANRPTEGQLVPRILVK